MADTIKSVKVKIQVDNKESLAASEKSTTSMEKMAKSAVKLAGAFIGLRAGFIAITKSVKFAIDAQETNSKFLTVFSDNATEATNAAKNLSENYILSSNASKKLLASTGDLLTGLGLTSKEALGLSVATVKMGSDLASFSNIQGGGARAATIITKSFTGEREGLKELGITINEAMLKARLLETGQDKLTGSALLAAKATETLNLIMLQSPNAIGDVARTMDSAANILKRFAADAEDLQEAFGGAIIEGITPALKDLSKWAKENKDTIARVFTTIGTAIGSVLKLSGKFVQFLAGVQDFITNQNQNPMTADDIISAETFGELRERWSAFGADVEANLGNISDAAKREFKEFDALMVDIAKSGKDVDIQAKLIRAEFDKLESGKRGTVLQEFFKKTLVSEKEWEKAIKDRASVNSKATEKAIEEAKKKAELERKLAVKRSKNAATNEKLKKKAIKLQEKERKAKEKFIEQQKIAVETGLSLAWVALQERDAKEKLAVAQRKVSDAKAVEAGMNAALAAQAKKLAEAHQKYLDKLTNGRNIMNATIGAFEDLGIISGEAAQSIANLGNAGFDIAEGFATGNPAQVIAGIGAALSEVISIFTGDGVGEAIERENAWMNVTEEQTEALRKLEEQLGSTHAATSAYLDTLIDGVVTLQNSDKWLRRIRGVLSDVDQGTLSAADAALEMGDAFKVWLEQAKELGTTGSKEFFAFVEDLKNRGIEVVEVSNFIKESWNSAADSWRQFKAETGSTISLPALDAIIEKQDELAKDKYQPALNGLKFINEALLNMSNATKLTNEELDAFEQAANTTFKTLIDQGLDSTEALKQMQPVLSRLNFLSEEHGLILDENTKKLIEDAKAAGIDLGVKKTLGEQQLELGQQQLKIFKLMAEALGVSSEAMDGFGESAENAFGKADKSLGKFGKNLGNLDIPDLGKMGVPGGGNIPKFASGGSFTVPSSVGPEGMPIIVDRNEDVNITPASKSGSRNGNLGDGITNHFNIQSNTGDDTVRQIIEGVKTNRFGLNKYLRGVLV